MIYYRDSIELKMFFFWPFWIYPKQICEHLIMMSLPVPRFSTKKITSYGDIVDYYKTFLQQAADGVDVDSPGGPIEQETIKILSYLQQINSKGIVTTCSQPGMKEVDDAGNRYEQRAFVSCYVASHKIGESIVRFINQETPWWAWGCKYTDLRQHDPTDVFPYPAGL